MDNKINFFFIINIIIAIMFLLGIPILGPVKVYASEVSGVPFLSPGSVSSYIYPEPPSMVNYGYSHYSIDVGPYAVYNLQAQDSAFGRTSYTLTYCLFSTDSSTLYINDSDSSFVYWGSYSYTKEYNGTVYNVYARTGQATWTVMPDQNIDYIMDINGTSVNASSLQSSLHSSQGAMEVANFFLFGEGDIDFEMPPQDISDSDLDIHGLDCVVLNDQQASLQVGQTLQNIWDRNVATWYSLIFDSPKDYISNGIENSGTQFIQNYVPGVSLLWDSPPVVDQSEALTEDNPVLYTIWIDGKTDIKYNSAVDAIKNFFSGTSVGSCAYSKLMLHDGRIVSNPYHTYYYNTNQGLETILDYISANTQFTRPTEYDQYQNICASTTISRIYIQAHQIDPETGDNRYGAITYVDLSNGIPTVYEGVTENNIDDIPASDPDDGATTDTSQPFTVSGDNIVYNYPVHQENPTGTGNGGLIVPASGFLSAGLALIQAILELIKMWFLLKLVPILTLGFTGHI